MAGHRLVFCTGASSASAPAILHPAERQNYTRQSSSTAHRDTKLYIYIDMQLHQHQRLHRRLCIDRATASSDLHRSAPHHQAVRLRQATSQHTWSSTPTRSDHDMHRSHARPVWKAVQFFINFSDATRHRHFVAARDAFKRHIVDTPLRRHSRIFMSQGLHQHGLHQHLRQHTARRLVHKMDT
ncbi:hypothetical protein VPH35_021048 [Triticum aestivum]